MNLLANSSWGADPHTLRTTALALCYSTAEYGAAVWSRSAHASRIDADLHKACRIITGNLKSTPLPALYRLCGISPPKVRRDAITRGERNKQLRDPWHPLYGHQEVARRLVSRRSFATVEELSSTLPSYRLQMWREADPHLTNAALPEPNEALPTGTHLPRSEWVTLNRARAKVAKTGDNLLKWGYSTTAKCPCGAEAQTIEHILTSCPQGPHCSDWDLRAANDTARRWLEKLSDKI